jgi:surface antigen
VLFEYGVFACRRAPAAFAVTALVAAMVTQSTIATPLAFADASATVEVQTQRMSDASLTSRQDGSYNAGDQLTLVCAKRGPQVRNLFNSSAPGRGNDLWYRTSDGHFVADADIETGTLKVAAPECNPTLADADAQSASATGVTRTAGATRAVNPGTPGQCTWGAAQKWFEVSGSYPALAGNAMSWNDNAAAAGWTVTDDPQDRSIVVFEPGVVGAGSVGHVAWVDSVSQRADGQWIHVTEMNNSYLGGVGIFNDRDVKNVPGMSYILLP